MQKKRRKKNNDAIEQKPFDTFLTFVKDSKNLVYVLFATFFVASIITFLDFGTREVSLQDLYLKYEVGQIAEETVVSSVSAPATQSYKYPITEGEKIIKKGFPISEEAYEKLVYLSKLPAKFDFKGFGCSILYMFVVLVVAVLLMFSFGHRKKLRTRDAIFLGAAFILVYSIAAIMVNFPSFSKDFVLCAIVPASLCAMLVTILFNLQMGNCFAVLFSLAVLGATSFNVVPSIFVLVTSLFGSLFVHKMDKRIDFMRLSFVLLIFNVVVVLILSFIFRLTSESLVMSLFCVAFSGFISGILVLGFITPLESLLNTVTPFRLMDLSDLNSSMMKHMQMVAPGTYNHSMMVANLAESACRKIDANPLLARVGGYYHDLGKLEQPEYFSENQNGDNKHDDINPSLSASVLRSHVKKGVEKARQLNLPQEVIDIIAEHHGNSVMKYFYNEAQKIDKDVSSVNFSYDGNPPSSKEAAVVMLADTVEAACRALDKKTVRSLENRINELVSEKINENQLNNAKLTFFELNKIKEVFLDVLVAHYHSRVKYPDQLEQENENASPKNQEKKESSGKNNSNAKNETKNPEFRIVR